MDELSAKGRVETLIRSLSRFSEQEMLITNGKSDEALEVKKISPSLISERLCSIVASEKPFAASVRAFVARLSKLSGWRYRRPSGNYEPFAKPIR